MKFKRIFHIYVWFSFIILSAGIVLPLIIKIDTGIVRIESWEYLFEDSPYEDIRKHDGWIQTASAVFRNRSRNGSSVLWLRTRLPDDLKGGTLLNLGTIYSSAIFRIDDDVLGIYGSDDPNYFHGFNREEYPLKQEYGGEYLYARVVSYFPLYIGIQSNVYLGTFREFFTHSLFRDILPLGFAFLYLVLGILLLLVRVYDADFTGIPFLALLNLLIGFYSFRYTDIKFLLPIDPFFWDIIGVAQTFCIPFLVLVFLRNFFSRYPDPLIRIPLWMNAPFAIMAVILPLLLYLFRGKDPFYEIFTVGIAIRVVFQIQVFISIILVCIFLIRVWKKGAPEALLILAGFIMLGFSSLSSLLGAAGLTIWNFTSHLHLGMFLFMSALILAKAKQLDTLLTTYREQIENYKHKRTNELPFETYKLSPREIDVVREVFLGIKNQEIASRLFISERTVKAHLSSIFAKCNVKSKIELVYLLSDAPDSHSRTGSM